MIFEKITQALSYSYATNVHHWRRIVSNFNPKFKRRKIKYHWSLAKLTSGTGWGWGVGTLVDFGCPRRSYDLTLSLESGDPDWYSHMWLFLSTQTYFVSSPVSASRKTNLPSMTNSEWNDVRYISDLQEISTETKTVNGLTFCGNFSLAVK